MDSSSNPDGLIPYSQAIKNVIEAGNKVIDWLPNDQKHKTLAFDRLSEATEVLLLQTEKLEQGSSTPDNNFFEAAIEMQAGYLLIEARRVIENGDKIGIQSALDNLRVEREASAGGPVNALRFEDDLLRSPKESMTDESALDDFKNRAARTLDNMVKEADEVLSSAIDKFKNTFDQFYEALGELLNSFSARKDGGAIAAGVEKVIRSLNRITEFVQNKGLQQTIESLKEMVHGLELPSLVAKAFGCKDTKEVIERVKLGPTVNRVTLSSANARMAELSRQYVLLLKQVRRVLSVVAAVGGMLLLTGVATHYAGPALPIAYALLALATILIGMNFAEVKMRRLISSL